MNHSVYEGNQPFIFISYAHKDAPQVIPLIRGLQDRGFRVWYDAGIEAGTEWPEYIAEHLENCSCVIAFISAAALASHNCRREINFAIELGKDPLVVHLEDVHMSAGMRMQLGTLQALFRQRHSSDQSFLDALAQAKLLAPCLNSTSLSSRASDSRTTVSQLTGIGSAAPDISATYSAAECCRKGRAFQNSKDYTQAVYWYRAAANRGHAQAQCNLGLFYEHGLGVPVDKAIAAAWYRKAADQGHAQSQCNLAFFYERGVGVEKDLTQAILLYRKSADQGYTRAQHNLGLCYAAGRGVPMDKAQAAAWYRKAADRGYVRAQYSLGICYMHGRGVPEDHQEAVRWYKKAAEQGHAGAQCNLGDCYEYGKGVSPDIREAVRLYKLSAGQGNAIGQCNLGECYEHGKGVPVDLKEAVRLYTLAAEQNDDVAQYYMGLCCEQGRGAVRNIAQAVTWYQKAASNGNNDAKQALSRLGYSY